MKACWCVEQIKVITLPLPLADPEDTTYQQWCPPVLQEFFWPLLYLDQNFPMNRTKNPCVCECYFIFLKEPKFCLLCDPMNDWKLFCLFFQLFCCWFWWLAINPTAPFSLAYSLFGGLDTLFYHIFYTCLWISAFTLLIVFQNYLPFFPPSLWDWVTK